MQPPMRLAGLRPAGASAKPVLLRRAQETSCPPARVFFHSLT